MFPSFKRDANNTRNPFRFRVIMKDRNVISEQILFSPAEGRNYI